MLLALARPVTPVADPLIGKRVFWKPGTEAMVDDVKVNFATVPLPATIEHFNEEQFWLGKA